MRLRVRVYFVKGLGTRLGSPCIPAPLHVTYAIKDIDGCIAGDEVGSPSAHSSRPPEMGLYIVWYDGSTDESGTHIPSFVCQKILEVSYRGKTCHDIFVLRLKITLEGQKKGYEKGTHWLGFCVMSIKEKVVPKLGEKGRE